MDWTTGSPQLTINPDGTVMKDGKLLGLPNNPGYIIDSTELKGPDGYTVVEEGTLITYYGGSAVRADGPNKKIAETGWVPVGTLRDNMIISAVIKADALPGGVKPLENSASLRGYIIRRDPKTKVETMRSTIAFSYDYASYDVGTCAKATWGASHAIDFFNFNDKYEYKIELWTDEKLDPNQSLILDYIYFTYISRSQWMGGQQPTIYGVDPRTEPVNIIECVMCSCSTDGSGNGIININMRRFMDEDASLNEMTAIFNNLNYVGFNFYEGSGKAGSSTTIYWGSGLVHGGPGFGIQIKVFGGTASTTIYGFALIIGTMNPSVV